ncbi:MAG: gas vesicle protein GvpO, partial [Candidatus Binataceae bacterium]
DKGVAKDPPIGRRKGEAAGAAAVAKHAKAELEAIIGLDADRVSAVERKPDGWHVTVDLVELRRIPAATDMLAAYEAVLGPTGVLLSYHRTRRYFRDQMIEES